MRAEIQVLEGKLALKSGAEGSSVDVNMQQMQVRSDAGRAMVIRMGMMMMMTTIAISVIHCNRLSGALPSMRIKQASPA